MDHLDPFKMTPAELEVCRCSRCEDALRMHGLVDRLIESQSKTMAALDRVEAKVARAFSGEPHAEDRALDERLAAKMRYQRLGDN